MDTNSPRDYRVTMTPAQLDATRRALGDPWQLDPDTLGGLVALDEAATTQTSRVTEGRWSQAGLATLRTGVQW